MKKLLKVSLVAMLVASPMVASAALPTGINYSNGTQTKTAITANANIATTSYVQGAYDAALDAVSAENTRAVAAETALSNAIGDTEYTGDSLTGAIAALQQANTDSQAAGGAESAVFTASEGNANSAALNGADEIGEAINNVAAAVDANTEEIGTYDTTNGSHTYIDTEDSIATNLEALDSQVSTNTTAIANVVNGTTDIAYDNQASGMTATNVQAAIDELKSGLTNAASAASGDVAAEEARATAAEGALDTRVSAIESATINVYGTWNSGTATPVNLFAQQQQQPTTPTTTEEPGEGSGTGGEQTGGEQQNG